MGQTNQPESKATAPSPLSPIEQHQILDNCGWSFLVTVNKKRSGNDDVDQKDVGISRFMRPHPKNLERAWWMCVPHENSLAPPERLEAKEIGCTECNCRGSQELYPSFIKECDGRVFVHILWSDHWWQSGPKDKEDEPILHSLHYARPWGSWWTESVKVIPAIYGRQKQFLPLSPALTNWIEGSYGKSVLIQSIQSPQSLLIFHGYHAMSLELSESNNGREVVRGFYSPVGNSGLVHGWLETNKWAYLLYTTGESSRTKQQESKEDKKSELQAPWKDSAMLRIPISVVDELYAKAQTVGRLDCERWEKEYHCTKELVSLIDECANAMKKTQNLPHHIIIPEEDLQLGCEVVPCRIFDARAWSRGQEERQAVSNPSPLREKPKFESNPNDPSTLKLACSHIISFEN